MVFLLETDMDLVEASALEFPIESVLGIVGGYLYNAVCCDLRSSVSTSHGNSRYIGTDGSKF